MGKPQGQKGPRELKIYFLPNLFTACNLFCGFLALTIIVSAPSLYHLEAGYSNMDDQFEAAKGMIYWALELILLACVFDAFDGRVARMGGTRVHSAGSLIHWRILLASGWCRRFWCIG